jgi:hypothetical protein
MLMYFTANMRPYIAYAAHQSARHTHDPKAAHVHAMKLVIRYRKGTNYKGIYFKPDGMAKVDCYVGSDFVGLFTVEDGQAPISAKSRTGYIILYYGVPLLWVSKMHTQTALSTVEVEYITLLQSMYDLIPVW